MKTRIGFIASLLAGLSLLFASSALAGVVGTGTPASCTALALSTQIVAGGTVTFNCGGLATIFLNMTIGSTNPPTTIDGGGQITLDGSTANAPIVWINGSGTGLPNITFRNITFANGSYTTGFNAGGAIVNEGMLTLNTVSFTNNHSFFGGAIVQEACVGCLEPSLSITQSTFTGNTAGTSGGAINVGGGILTIMDSTFSGNSGGTGGALDLYLNSGQTRTVVAITGSTFSNNTAANSGGAIYGEPLGAQGSLSIINSTFSGNSANGTTGNPAAALYAGGSSNALSSLTFSGNTATSGAGVYLTAGSIVRNTIIAGNGAQNCQLGGALGAGSTYNLQFGDTSCTGFISGDPMLGPLGNNSGPTSTMLPGTGSAAINAIPVASCTETVDQRGMPRPSGSGCDIGAVEVQTQQPQAAPVSVPTLGTTGLIVAAILLALAGIPFIRKRAQTP